MIIVALKGGLGNQMFQYACGRALSIRNNDILKMDITGYELTKKSDTPRDYLLSNFNVKENFAPPEEIRSLKYPYCLISKGWRFARAKILRQFNTDWIPNVFSKKGSFYLDGFWQTEKYFMDQEDVIRREFTLNKPFCPAAQSFADMIRESKDGIISGTSKGATTISLHVRRGDVAKDAKTNPYYGVTTPEYYEKALTVMVGLLKDRGEKKDLRIFVFSDDIDWVQKNIPIPYPTTYVRGDGIADYEELALMSQCQHNIIANSSFSWWGAWLNKNPYKIVIAPKQWIRGCERRHKDIAPDSWVRI